MSLYIYPAQPIDRNVLFDLDVKCCDYPIPTRGWQEITGSSQGEYSHFTCEVYKRNNTPYGYIVFSEIPIEKSNAKDDLCVYRIGVHPQLRRQGIGTILVDRLSDICFRKNLDQFQITIPEYWMDPDENRGIKEFADACNLVLFSQEKEAFLHYGKIYDGIVYRSGGTPVTAGS